MKWGIMGTGRVCNDFVQALKATPGAKIQAVCSRTKVRAAEFAEKHGIPVSHGSYQELAEDPEVQVVYIGSLHPLHREHAEMCLMAGKHCLVEKPFTCTVDDAKFLVNLAKEKGLFIMEGMWTRFFPAVKKAREIVNSGAIGKVTMVNTEFCFDAISDNDAYPDSDMYSVPKGGGGAWYVGPYVVSAATMAFNGEKPTVISAAGLVDDKTGVDLSAACCLQFGAKGLATLNYSLQAESLEETRIVGNTGRITINAPSHCPEAITVTKKLEGRGNVSSEVMEFPLPELPECITSSGGFVYPNSMGFMYEAMAVQDYIRKGVTESPEYTHEEMITGMEILCRIRDQVGVESAPFG